MATGEAHCASANSSLYDLFRAEKARSPSTWDAVEPTPPHDKWTNTNGKFQL